MPKIPMTILARARRGLGFSSQETLAAALGLSRKTIGRYERDTAPAWYRWVLRGLRCEKEHGGSGQEGER